VWRLSRDPHEFWLPLGDTLVNVNGKRRHVAALENLITGERSSLDWGGIKLRIEPDRDPALLFRCLA
jgi:starch synthase (maltosyl-transferring)